MVKKKIPKSLLSLLEKKKKKNFFFFSDILYRSFINWKKIFLLNTAR